MKKSIEMAFSIIFISFCSVVFTCIIYFQYQIAKTNDFHYAMVNEIESSDFSSTVINRYMNNHQYDVSIVNKTLKNDLGIYQVTTTKKVGIPIFKFYQNYVKESVAR